MGCSIGKAIGLLYPERGRPPKRCACDMLDGKLGFRSSLQLGEDPMKRLLLVLLVSCACLLPLIAQIQNARIEGTVQDASGAVIPNAKLVIVNLKTQAKLEAESDASGFYVFPSLPPA